MNTRKYEAFYMVSGALDDSAVQKISDHFKAVVEKEGGSVSAASKWDKRKLAYEVNGQKEANYILMNFESDAKVPAELRRQMRNSDDIIRQIIIRLDHEVVPNNISGLE
jgi:small subunit ribosomal protein S6